MDQENKMIKMKIEELAAVAAVAAKVSLAVLVEIGVEIHLVQQMELLVI